VEVTGRSGIKIPPCGSVPRVLRNAGVFGPLASCPFRRPAKRWSNAISPDGWRPQHTSRTGGGCRVVDEGCRRARERGQIDIVRSATYIDTEDKRMAIRRAADIGAQLTTGISAPLVLLWHGSPPMR
jgi:hypothetical protein